MLQAHYILSESLSKQTSSFDPRKVVYLFAYIEEKYLKGFRYTGDYSDNQETFKKAEYFRIKHGPQNTDKKFTDYDEAIAEYMRVVKKDKEPVHTQMTVFDFI